MNVKDAVAAAKAFVSELYDDSERVSDISLEEVAFDDASDAWMITVEFSRPVNDGFRTRARELIEAASGDVRPRRRVQKVVVVSDRDRKAISMRNREAA